MSPEAQIASVSGRWRRQGVSASGRQKLPIAVQSLASRLAGAGGILLFLAIVAFFALRAPGFLTPANLGLILSQSAVLGLLGFGLTIVLIVGGTDVISGGIDLSLAGTLGLAAAIFAALNQLGYGDVVCVVAALAVGVAVGLTNAVGVVLLGVPPLLATLAVMNICGGLELVVTENTTIPASSPLLDSLGLTGWGDIPVLAYVLIAVALVLGFALRFTPLGVRAEAVGAHREAARAAGVATLRYVAGSYVLSGALGAGAGILSVAFLSGATGGSAEMLLPVVATAFLGTMFSRRFVPTIGGTLIAAAFLGALSNGFQLLHVSTYWVNGIEGALILVVVGGAARGGVRGRR